MAWKRVHEQMLSWHPDIKMQFSAPKNPPVSLETACMSSYDHDLHVAFSPEKATCQGRRLAWL